MGKELLIFITLVSCLCAAVSGDPLTYSLDSLLNTKVTLFPGDSVTVQDNSDVSINKALADVQKAISDPKKSQLAYRTYQAQFGKPVSGSKDRLNVFSNNVYNIIRNNLYTRLGRNTYERAVNQFSDLTSDEAVATYTGALVPGSNVSSTERPVTTTTAASAATRHFTLRPVSQYPASFSWLDQGYVSPVKNQGQCGSCVMFAVTAAIESAYAIDQDRWNATFTDTNRKLRDLSEQQILDCVDGPGVGKCNGNTVPAILDYVKGYGQTAESRYPYRGQVGTCLEKVDTTFYPTQARPMGYWKVDEDEEKLKQTLVDNGPVVVLIHTSGPIFSYSRGVYSDPCYGNVNHAVLVVGYGTENGLDYWMIKNSWGTTWGDKGFIKIKRNINHCKVRDWAYVPISWADFPDVDGPPSATQAPCYPNPFNPSACPQGVGK